MARESRRRPGLSTHPRRPAARAHRGLRSDRDNLRQATRMACANCRDRADAIARPGRSPNAIFGHQYRRLWHRTEDDRISTKNPATRPALQAPNVHRTHGSAGRKKRCSVATKRLRRAARKTVQSPPARCVITSPTAGSYWLKVDQGSLLVEYNCVNLPQRAFGLPRRRVICFRHRDRFAGV
jgi:hypothetical protein